MAKESKLDQLKRVNENLVNEISRLKVENDQLRETVKQLKGEQK